jgi:uncharacterized membrane protein
MDVRQSKTVVVRFADFDSANRALRKLRDAQKKKRLQIHRGAVVVGTAEGAMPVKSLDDMGLGDVGSNLADLAVFFGLGSARIVAETALAGAALLLSSTRRAAALGGSLLLLPARMLVSSFQSGEITEGIDALLEPGACAVVAVVDSQGDADQIVADLSEYGGEAVAIEIAADPGSST